MLKYIFCFSCVTWSSYHKNVLASSDYEGTITLWDAFTGQKSKLFQVLYIKFKIYIWFNQAIFKYFNFFQGFSLQVCVYLQKNIMSLGKNICEINNWQRIICRYWYNIVQTTYMYQFYFCTYMFMYNRNMRKDAGVWTLTQWIPNCWLQDQMMLKVLWNQNYFF